MLENLESARIIERAPLSRVALISTSPNFLFLSVADGSHWPNPVKARANGSPSNAIHKIHLLGHRARQRGKEKTSGGKRKTIGTVQGTQLHPTVS